MGNRFLRPEFPFDGTSDAAFDRLNAFPAFAVVERLVDVADTVKVGLNTGPVVGGALQFLGNVDAGRELEANRL